MLKGKGESAAASGLGVMGVAMTGKMLFDLVREVSFDDIKDEAARPPRFLVMATSNAEAEQFARLVTGAEDLTGVGLGTIDTQVWNATSYDAILVHDPLNTGAAKRLNITVAEGITPPVVIESYAPFDATEANRVRQRMSDALNERAIPFARNYPALRPAVMSRIITDASTANAQFALVANIPALIPVVGGFLSAGADMILLTKNQMMMVYKIAAASGRELDNHQAILKEMTPVVGAGFLWRTLAREATSFLPLAAGTIPKVAIAFTGTFALGRAAEMFYRFGKKPSAEQRAEFYAQAREMLSRLPFGKKEQDQVADDVTEIIEAEAKPAA
jgi:uncharacterized protein (DUF697 family)